MAWANTDIGARWAAHAIACKVIPLLGFKQHLCSRPCTSLIALPWTRSRLCTALTPQVSPGFIFTLGSEGWCCRRDKEGTDKKTPTIPIALYADNGKHPSRYWGCSYRLQFRWMQAVRAVPFCSSSSRHENDKTPFSLTWLSFKENLNFKSLNFFNELRDLVVFPDLVLFGIISTVSLIWLEWY